MSLNLYFINTYNAHKNERKKIPAEECGGRIRDVSQLAPTTGREATGIANSECFPLLSLMFALQGAPL